MRRKDSPQSGFLADERSIYEATSQHDIGVSYNGKKLPPI
jgi:hypothetical protein